MADEQPRPKPIVVLKPGDKWSTLPKGTLVTGVNGSPTVWRVANNRNLIKHRG